MPSPPGNTLVSGTAQKTAGDRIRLPMDFGNEKLLLEGAQVINGELVLLRQIVAFNVIANPPDLIVSGQQLDNPYQLSALISGGTGGGSTYYLTYMITLNDPDSSIISRTAPLTVL